MTLLLKITGAVACGAGFAFILVNWAMGCNPAIEPASCTWPWG